MVLTLPFGKYKGKQLSLEQVLIKDYPYFEWIREKVFSTNVRERMDYLKYISNNYESVVPCKVDPNKKASFVSLYYGFDHEPLLNFRYAYSDSEIWRNDPEFTDQVHKTRIQPLGADLVLLSRKKVVQDHLMKGVIESMGMTAKRKNQEYLYDFFNNLKEREQ